MASDPSGSISSFLPHFGILAGVQHGRDNHGFIGLVNGVVDHKGEYP